MNLVRFIRGMLIFFGSVIAIFLLLFLFLFFYTDLMRSYKNSRASQHLSELDVRLLHVEPIYWEEFAKPVGLRATIQVSATDRKNACLSPDMLLLRDFNYQNSITRCKDYMLKATTNILIEDFYIDDEITRMPSPDKLTICNQSIKRPAKNANDSDPTLSKISETSLRLSYWEMVSNGQSGLATIVLPLPQEPWIMEMKKSLIATQQQFLPETLEEKGFQYEEGTKDLLRLGCFSKPSTIRH